MHCLMSWMNVLFGTSVLNLIVALLSSRWEEIGLQASRRKRTHHNQNVFCQHWQISVAIGTWDSAARTAGTLLSSHSPISRYALRDVRSNRAFKLARRNYRQKLKIN